MTDDEIMEIYHGFDKETYKAIEKYVSIFHTPWPTYGPRDVELIEHCIDLKKSIDDLPSNDKILRKYYNRNIIY